MKFQRVYHLNAENLAPYDAFTYPSLQKRWQTQSQRGELIGVSASAAGEMIGMAIAERLLDGSAELLSLFVQPAYRHQGIGTRLMDQLQQGLAQNCDRVQLSYQATTIAQMALSRCCKSWAGNRPSPPFCWQKRRHLRSLPKQVEA